MIKVKVVRARKLTAADITGASDPYVIVFTEREDEAKARRTKTIDDTLEPGTREWAVCACSLRMQIGGGWRIFVCGVRMLMCVAVFVCCRVG